MSLFSHLRAAVQKRAAYRQTVRELQGIPAGMAEDIGIFPGDARRIARDAIYG